MLCSMAPSFYILQSGMHTGESDTKRDEVIYLIVSRATYGGPTLIILNQR
jgi:hypothetical protein